jgi:hypothetical protein
LVLPAAVFVLTRVWLMLIPFGHIPYRGGTLVINDLVIYADWARTLEAWTFPVGDEMWQYPPLAAPVFALGAVLPPDPTTGLAVLMLAFDTATFALLAHRVLRGGSSQGLWTWVAAGFLLGPIWLTRFDVVPATFAVLGLLSIQRPARAGVWMAVGALLKVWPALLLIAVPRRSLIRAVPAFLITAAGSVLILALLWDGVGAFATQQRDRGLQVESVPAWLFLVAHHLGWERGFVYRFGAMEVEAAGTAVVAVVVTALGAAAMLALLWARLRGRLEQALPADVALVAVLLSMVTSRVLSPQYLVWVAAVAAVCLLDTGTQMRPVVPLLAAVAGLGQVLYPMHYEWLLSEGLLGLALQTARVLLLLVATAWAIRRLLWGLGVRSRVRVDTVEQVGQPA